MNHITTTTAQASHAPTRAQQIVAAINSQESLCPLCNKAVKLHHMPSIDRVTQKLAHDICVRMETHRSYADRSRNLLADIAKGEGE